MITIKSKEEVEKLIEGGKRLAHIISELSKFVAPGVSTQIFEDRTREILKETGDRASFLGYTPAGARRPYPASVCISINDEIVHGIPNENPKILKEGDLITIDMGLVHQGMYVDSAVTLGVGSVSEEAKLLMRANKEALQAGIDKCLSGVHTGDIASAIEAVARKYKFNLAEDLCGHGVGYEVHEDPFIPNYGDAGKGEVLRPGMVIAIEPMLILEQTPSGLSKIKLDKDGYTYKTKSGAVSAHFEHTVVITEGSPLVVTRV